MSDPTHISRTNGAAQIAAPVKHTDTSCAPSTSAAFHALIEKLQAQAQDLETRTQGVSDAKDLAGAVDRARDSLEGVLSLGESLIEAYRQSVHQSSAQAQSGDGSAPKPR